MTKGNTSQLRKEIIIKSAMKDSFYIHVQKIWCLYIHTLTRDNHSRKIKENAIDVKVMYTIQYCMISSESLWPSVKACGRLQ